jgi:hypothetical protein
MLRQLHAFSLPRQTRLLIIRILCVAQTANPALSDFDEIKRSRAVQHPESPRCTSGFQGAHFSDIPRRRKERLFNLAEISNYIMIHYSQMIGFSTENGETDFLAT